MLRWFKANKKVSINFKDLSMADQRYKSSTYKSCVFCNSFFIRSTREFILSITTFSSSKKCVCYITHICLYQSAFLLSTINCTSIFFSLALAGDEGSKQNSIKSLTLASQGKEGSSFSYRCPLGSSVLPKI